MNNKKTELIRNTFIIMFGKLCTQFVSFLLLPLYTKYIITKDFGFIDLIHTYVSLFVPVITLQLEMAAFRMLIDSRNKDDETSTVISTSFGLLFTYPIIIICIYFIFVNYFKIKYGYIIGIIIFVSMVYSFLLQTSRGLGDNIKYSVACSINGLSLVIFNIITIVVFDLGVKGMLISMISAYILASIYLYTQLNLQRYVKMNKIKKSIGVKMLKYSLPLVPNGISWWIVNASDRTIISIFLGVTSNGIYAVSNKFSSLFAGIFNVFQLSWTETVSLHINDHDNTKFITSSMNSILKLLVSICVIMIGVMPFLFKILIDNNYYEAYYNIPILMVGMLFSVIVGLYAGIYIALKKTKQVMYTSLISAALNILLNVLLIRYIGLYAASISTLIAYAVMAISRDFGIKKYHNIKWDYKFIFISICFFVVEFYTYYKNETILNIIMLFTSLIFSCFTLRKYIIESIKNIKKKHYLSK